MHIMKTKPSALHVLCGMFLAAILFLPSALFAQQDDHLTVDLQMMTRGEIRDGGLSPDADEAQGDWANFVLSRTRLVTNYHKRHLDAKVNIQHSGIWGQAGRGSVNIHEAWAKLSSAEGLFIQAGRIALSYDDERIIGLDDWTMTGNSHDVLRLGFDGSNHRVHLFAAFNQNEESITSGSSFYTGGSLPYKTMQTAWYHLDIPQASLGFSLLAMNIGMQAGEQGKNEHLEWQQLAGGYAKWTPINGTLSLEASYYRQMGKDENGLKIDAWMASAKATVNPSSALGFEGGYDYLSGDPYFAVPASGEIGLTRHEVVRGFNPVYGSHHKFYGAMDFFYVSTYFHGFTPGLQNAWLGVKYQPLSWLNVAGAYHYMSTAIKLDNMDRTLGHQFELSASCQLIQDVNLTMGVSYMTGAETMERLKRASDDGRLRWYWLSLNVNPRIFTH